MNNPYNFQLFNWHLEISTKCALQCPRCPRTEKPGQFRVGEMPLEFIQEIFSPRFLRENVHRIILCGGQGDPIYHGKFHEIVKYLKGAHPELSLQITTNGSYRSEIWWEELAQILDEKDIVVFSIDGWDQSSNELYRKGCDFSSIELAISAMAKSQAHIQWSAIAFKFNEDRLDDLAEKAKSLGCDSFTVTLSSLFGSQNPVYLNQDGKDPLEPTRTDLRTKYGRHQRVILQNSNASNVQEKLFEKMESRVNELQDSFADHYVKPLCMSGMKAMYIDVDGILYPCSWLSHPFGIRKSKISGRELKYEDSLFTRFREAFDLNHSTLEDVINSKQLKGLVEGWKYSEGCFIECEQKCTAPWEHFFDKRSGFN